MSTCLHVAPRLCPRCVRALSPCTLPSISGSQGTPPRRSRRCRAAGIYCQTPAAAGAGIGASTMCITTRKFLNDLFNYMLWSQNVQLLKVDRLPTLTRLCSVAPLFRESPRASSHPASSSSRCSMVGASAYTRTTGSVPAGRTSIHDSSANSRRRGHLVAYCHRLLPQHPMGIETRQHGTVFSIT